MLSIALVVLGIVVTGFIGAALGAYLILASIQRSIGRGLGW